MKKALFAGMLVASQLCSAQRVLEITSNSWNNQDLSVETYADFVITGCTDLNPATNKLSPMFKRTVVGGAAVNSFYVDLPDEVYLMDFVMRQQAGTIILTGMTADPNNPYRMFVAEVDMLGNVLQSYYHSDPGGRSLVPHQVIQSQASGQVVIVGTKISGTLQGPPANVLKTGFILVLDQNNYNTILTSTEMDSPAVGPTDNDMLESVCEVPNVGYCIAGSANNPGANEQNLLMMGMSYTGAVTFSTIYDNTISQYCSASLLYRFTASGPVVYLLANNNTTHTFEIVAINGMTGVPGTPWYRYIITNLPVPVGSGIDVNGFRLQLNASNQIVISGYISAPTGALPQLLTPFQMVLSPNLATYIQGKLYQSANNSPLTGYFNESGNSVYINTPDICVYNGITQKAYLVNPSTGGGFDLCRSTPALVSGCESGLKTQQFVFQVPVVAHPNYFPMQVVPTPVPASPYGRQINEVIVCPFAMIVNPNVNGTASLYPNPATDELAVSLETEITGITIKDMKGNTVIAISGSERNSMHATVNISGLQAGAYLIDITDADGIVHRERFIKE